MKKCLLGALFVISLLLYPASVAFSRLDLASSTPVSRESTPNGASSTPRQTPQNDAGRVLAPETGHLPSRPLSASQAVLRGAIADTISDVEGQCTPGQSGEYGCFQILPGTWRAYSIDVAGKVLPQTEANERYIVEGKIDEWLADGITPRGIFLTWNQGSATGWGGGTDCYAGTNKWGVHYDSCDYAHRALSILAQRLAHSE